MLLLIDLWLLIIVCVVVLRSCVCCGWLLRLGLMTFCWVLVDVHLLGLFTLMACWALQGVLSWFVVSVRLLIELLVILIV